MKKLIYILLFSLPLNAMAFSEKRGLSENEFNDPGQIEVLAPGVNWYYNWGNAENKGVDGQDMMEYVPMCWNGSYNANTIRDYCKNHPETKYLLGFNEPNFRDQANMTPKAAAAAWPKVQQLAKEFDLKIVAPAMNYSPDAPYYTPESWMDEFVELVGLDAFDYVAIHSYGGAGLISYLADFFYKRYGKPVWVTEFCLWQGNHTPEEQISDMMASVEWMEKSDCVFRYGWFKAVGYSTANAGPNYGLLVKKGANWELSEQGKVYTYMSNFDSEVYYPVNTMIPSSEYISSKGILLGGTKDSEAKIPIEITKFNNGATVDYQFDVPEDSAYELVLRVSGIGSPSKADPSLAVGLLNKYGFEKETILQPTSFTLSNSNEIYSEVKFNLNLNKGKQTIRLRDGNPKEDSGLRISGISLNKISAGISEISLSDETKLVDVYDLQGICIKKKVAQSEALIDLPAGIYIIEDKKVIKN